MSQAPALAPLAWAPPEATLTRMVVPVRRSRTKTSGRPFVSPSTRLEAYEVNITYRPLDEVLPP